MHSAICDFVSDIAQNAVEAGSTLVILDMRQTGPRLEVCVSDNGKGMDEETLKKAVDPFFTDGKKHQRRSVGLGLPFLKQAAEAAGGAFEIKSEPGMGTSVFFAFDLTNIDAPPVGNVSGTVMALFNYPGDYELVFNRELDGKKYSASRETLRETLGDMESADSLVLAEQYISSLEEELTNQR